MKSSFKIVRWLLAIGLLGAFNAYAQNSIYCTGRGSGFTVSTISPSGGFVPLPVDLMYFKAIPQDDYLLLQWATASECNNSHFTIERSADGMTFSPVMEVEGAGNTVSELKYQAVDDAPMPGRTFYRLRQTDFNGETTVSQVVPVFFSSAYNVSVYPTLATDFVTISLAGHLLPRDISVAIIDASGRTLSERTLELDYNSFKDEVKVPVLGLTPGLYLIRATNQRAGLSVQERFIVQ